MTHIVEVRSLTHAYGATEAIHDVGFALPAGEILGLIGPNGAGKTTTLQILGGVLLPRSGSACVLGQPCARLDPATRAAIGFVSERLQLPEQMKAGALIDFCRSFHADWDAELAERLRRDFGLDRDARVRALSRGQRAKLAYLLAVSYRPRLLLLDEPFGGLDPLARSEILDEMLALVAETGCSVLVATHDLGEVERITDRVALLHTGRLVFCEPVDAVLERHRRVRLTFDSDRSCEAHRLERGIEPHREGRVLEYVETEDRKATDAPKEARVETHAMSLEEIFVAWTRHLNRRAVS
jgi:ABC-2 type transport system ATP-binding protein